MIMKSKLSFPPLPFSDLPSPTVRSRRTRRECKMENILDKLVETYPKTFSNPSPNYLTKHAIIWNSEFMNISGDTSFHLAYTYMRCGKIQYALEEIRKAIKAYNFIDPASISLQFPDSLPADDHSFLPRKSDLDLMQKTRHAWGLLAVITCNMGADPEAREECQMALRNVKCLTVGPYQSLQSSLLPLTHSHLRPPSPSLPFASVRQIVIKN
jgi:hypothetical protein